MLYRFDGFDLDDEVFVLRRGGADVALRPQALDVLLHLVRHRDRVVLKNELLQAVWSGAAVSDNALPQAIVAVRRALGDDDAVPRIVQTIRSRGYRFVAQVEVSSNADGAVAVAPPGELVGRIDSLSSLEQLVRQAAGGRPGIALVAGGPGAGKTRILAELARRTRAAARVLEAQCLGDEGVPDLWPWLRILRGCAEGSTPPLSDEATRLAASFCGPVTQGSAKQPFVAFDDVVQLLRRAAAQKPVVLLVDDLHHADAPSLLLTKLLVSSLRGARIAVVLAYRDTELGGRPVLARTLGALTREHAVRPISLAPFTRAEVAILCASMLGRAVDEPFVTRVFDKTNGNPLLTTQMVQAVHRDESAGSPGAGTTSALLSVGELREAIGLQLEGLCVDTRRILRAASVLGTELTLGRLAATLGVGPAELLEAVEEATRARVLLKSPSGAYRFVHVLVRDVLYRELAVGERFALHRSAGRASMAQDAPEDAVCHLERALRVIDVSAVLPDLTTDDDARTRAEGLLQLLKSGAAMRAG